MFSVLGRITSEKPEILITAGSNQQEKKLKLEEVFDFECEKLHEDSDYSIPVEQLANVTERKYTPPAYNYNNYYNNYNKPATGVKPATTVGGTKHKPAGNYYNSSKQTLINKINSYATAYSLSSLGIQDVCIAFLDFLEEEALLKQTTYSTDLQEMGDCTDNILTQFEATFHTIMIEHGLEVEDDSDEEPKANAGAEEATESQTSVEKDEQDVTDFALQQFTPNFHS